MIFEGVNFNEEAIKGMTLECFRKQNENHLWKDRDPKVRQKMLEEVYHMVNPKKPEPAEEKAEQ